MVWYFINLVWKLGSLKQHFNPFCSIKHSHYSKHQCIWFFEAAEWVQILFERPQFLNKVHKIPKYYPVKKIGLLNHHLDPFWSFTIFNAPTSASTPKWVFEPLKKFLTFSNFVYCLIELSTPPSVFFMSLVAYSPSYSSSCPPTFNVGWNPHCGILFPCIEVVKHSLNLKDWNQVL